MGKCVHYHNYDNYILFMLVISPRLDCRREPWKSLGQTNFANGCWTDYFARSWLNFSKLCRCLKNLSLTGVYHGVYSFCSTLHGVYSLFIYYQTSHVNVVSMNNMCKICLNENYGPVAICDIGASTCNKS